MRFASFQSYNKNKNGQFLETSHVLFSTYYTLCGIFDSMSRIVYRNDVTCKTCRKMIQKLANKL